MTNNETPSVLFNFFIKLPLGKISYDSILFAQSGQLPAFVNVNNSVKLPVTSMNEKGAAA
jgi:hypothetical protein